MKNADVKDATRIWDLAVLDTGVKGLTYDDESVYFEGYHLSARRALREPLIQGITSPVVVSGSTLNATLGLLDEDANVVLRCEKNKHIMLSSRATRARIAGEEGSPWGNRVLEKKHRTAKVPREKLKEAVGFTAQVIAREMSKPVLTGIQCTLAGSRIVLKGTNGGGFAGITWAPAKGDEMEFVMPPADLLVTLNALDGETVTLSYDGKKVQVSDGTTDVICSTLNGEFPDLSKLPRDYKNKLTIPRSAIALIQRAADVYDVNRLATLTIKGGKVSLSVRGDERGAFASEVSKGTVDDTAITFDSHLLSAAMALGKTITVNFNNPHSIVLMTGEAGRFFWISPQARIA